MSWLSKLFGGGKAEEPAAAAPKAAEEYKGFRIIPGPIKEGGQYRVAARIEKVIDGTVMTHQLVRADTMGSLDDALSISAAKARQVIDEQGDAVFR
jgi:hypothetical protein